MVMMPTTLVWGNFIQFCFNFAQNISIPQTEVDVQLNYNAMIELFSNAHKKIKVMLFDEDGFWKGPWGKER